MKTFKTFLPFMMLLFISHVGYSQNAEMADTFRQDGKIYVVVGIILIVLVGLITYLFLLDRKLNKLEQLIRSKKQTK